MPTRQLDFLRWLCFCIRVRWLSNSFAEPQDLARRRLAVALFFQDPLFYGGVGMVNPTSADVRYVVASSKKVSILLPYLALFR
jgi:hypothetical protein